MNKYTYAPPTTEAHLRRAYLEEGMSQNECAILFETSQKRIFTAMKHFGINARVAAKRNQTGEMNDSWRGDIAGKQAFHRRLYAIHGKPCACSVCQTTDPKNSYDYANLTGRYHDLKDYKAMCRSCHWKYDKKIRNIKHMRRDADGKA